jgi:hypothetical protein
VTIAKVGDGAVVTRVVRQDIHAREPLPFDELDGVTHQEEPNNERRALAGAYRIAKCRSRVHAIRP